MKRWVMDKWVDKLFKGLCLERVKRDTERFPSCPLQGDHRDEWTMESWLKPHPSGSGTSSALGLRCPMAQMPPKERRTVPWGWPCTLEGRVPCLRPLSCILNWS